MLKYFNPGWKEMERERKKRKKRASEEDRRVLLLCTGSGRAFYIHTVHITLWLLKTLSLYYNPLHCSPKSELLYQIKAISNMRLADYNGLALEVGRKSQERRHCLAQFIPHSGNSQPCNSQLKCRHVGTH